MEPQILMIGRKQEVIDILIEELQRLGRNVMGSNDKTIIETMIQEKSIDLVVVGAGLPDEVRKDMKDFLLILQPNLSVHLIERSEKSSPYQLIEFTHQKAVEWKVAQKLGKKPTQ